jgi:DNA glycosylase AlkZ-like
VAHDLCGLHAQVQASAELQVAVRVDGVTQAEVREALWERRALAKAWTVRGTVHIHPAPELPLWLAARRAVAPMGDDQGLPPWPDPNGVLHPAVPAAEVAAVRAAVWEALDGRCLLREEIVAAVGDRCSPAARSRLASGFAFFLGGLCQGPPEGSRVRFARPDQWVRDWHEVDPTVALEQVCLSFVATYGPVQPRAFKAWFDVSDPQALFDSLGEKLRRGDERAVPNGASVRLLPEYDPYVMGFRERDELIPDSVRELVAAHGRGRYEGPAAVRFLMLDGVAAGVWGRRKRGKRIDLDVTLVRRLTRAQESELAHEAERIGAFLGLEPVLSTNTIRA